MQNSFRENSVLLICYFFVLVPLMFCEKNVHNSSMKEKNFAGLDQTSRWPSQNIVVSAYPRL
jgi:hypothetical protein